MPAVRGDWPDHVRPGARKAFANEYPQLEAHYPTFFQVDGSTRAFEEELVSTGLGTVGLKPEATSIPLDKPRPRGKVTYIHATYGLGYEVSQELWEDELYGAVVPPSSRFLAAAMRDGEEIVAASVFNLAFTTQQAYDGVSLIDVAHPGIGIADQANQPATPIDVSVAALQSAMERYMLRTDDRGLRIKIRPEQLIHHPNNFWLVRAILGSAQTPFTANNEPNIVAQQGLTPETWPFLTDTDAWYLQGPKKLRPQFFWRRKPAMDDDYDKKDQVAQFFISARFTAGVTDWKGLDGSVGA